MALAICVKKCDGWMDDRGGRYGGKRERDGGGGREERGERERERVALL